MMEVNSFAVDNERFTSIVTITDDKEKKGKCAPTENASLTTLTTSTSETLHILEKMNSAHLSTKGILDTVNQYHLRELSLPYSLLNDELLKALSHTLSANLETLRIETHPETKPLPQISIDTWFAFTNQLPNINLIVLSYMTDENDFDPVIASYIPITHLYLGESTPSTIVDKIGSHCPRLIELVIGAYGPDTLDQTLISTVRGCPRLSAVGLGDCELTCSGFVEFVKLCCKRLRVLYVWETSLLEDSNFDTTEVITKISSLLGRNWEPEYVPFW